MYKQYGNIQTKTHEIIEGMKNKQLFNDTQQSAYNLYKHIWQLYIPIQKREDRGSIKLYIMVIFFTDNVQICNAMFEYFVKWERKRKLGQKEMTNLGD